MLFVSYFLVIFLAGCVPISGNTDRIFIINPGYKFVYDASGGSSIGNEDGDIFIDIKVTKLNWNNEYLIVEQKDDQGSLFKRYKDLLNHPKDDYEGYGYWIIDRENDERYGPFTKAAFEQKKKELGINLELIEDKKMINEVDPS